MVYSQAFFSYPYSDTTIAALIFKVYFANLLRSALSHIPYTYWPFSAYTRNSFWPFNCQANIKRHTINPIFNCEFAKIGTRQAFESLAIAVKIQLEHKSNQYESNFFGSLGIRVFGICYLANANATTLTTFCGPPAIRRGQENRSWKLVVPSNCNTFLWLGQWQNSATIWLTG